VASLEWPMLASVRWLGVEEHGKETGRFWDRFKQSPVEKRTAV
jgi:hypothetical protein